MKLISKKTGDIVLQENLPPFFSVEVLPNAQVRYGKWLHGQLLFQDITIPSYQIKYLQIVGEGKDTLLSIESGPTLLFHVSLQGTVAYLAEGLDRLTFHERAYNFYYLTEWSTEQEVRKDITQTDLRILIPLSLLDELASTFPFIEPFIARVRLNKPARLTRINQIACQRMMEKIEGIKYRAAQHEYEELIGKLLQFAIENISTTPQRKTTRLTQPEIDKVYDAKKILEKNLNKNYTLQELANEVAMNFNRLKKGFKEIFNQSAHSLQHEQRMKLASVLLSDERRLTMAEIAAITGYADQASFVRAFKRYYGEYPHGYRQKNKKN